MEQDNQEQFISWLAQKLGAKDQNELKSKIQQLGNDGIKQAYQAFMQEQNQQVQSAKAGAKLNYIQCLKSFQKGGTLATIECGCKDPEKKIADPLSQKAGQTDGQAPVLMAKGGVAGKSMGKRMDQDMDDMKSKKGDGRWEAKSAEKNPGAKDWMSTGKKTVDKGNGTRNDNKGKDKNPGAKDSMTLGDKAKWQTALAKVPKGKEGMITPAQKKMIMLKKKDEKK